MKNAYIAWEAYEEESCYLIHKMFVPADERGQGKGRQMLQDAIEEMRAEGKFDLIKLCADSEAADPNEPIDLADLVEFYESEGFEIEHAGDVVTMEMAI